MTRLPALRSAALFARWEGAARHNLAASAVETMRLADLLDMADAAEREDWNRLRLDYCETRGTAALREAIAKTYLRVTPDEVLGFSSGKEAIFAVVHALLDEGDEVLTFTPNYQPLESVPRLRGRVRAVPLREADGWRMDLDDVRRAMKPRTRLICLNAPHNPTGAVPDRETFDGLVRLAAEHDTYILSDEVYRGLDRDPERCLPQMADAYDKGLSLNVLSKTLGLPGLRVGWLAGRDRAALDRVEAFKDYLSDGNAGPSEVLARVALHNAGPILTRNRGIAVANLLRLASFFRDWADLFDWAAPSTGCIAYPRYKGTDGVEAFCAEAVGTAGILLLPASVYASDLGPTPPDRFRIGFGKLSMGAGLDALAAFLAARPHSGASAAGGRKLRPPPPG